MSKIVIWTKEMTISATKPSFTCGFSVAIDWGAGLNPLSEILDLPHTGGLLLNRT